MPEQTNDLETLITRILDNEATTADRRTLEAHLQNDGVARALFAETSAVDSAAGQAMRSAMRGVGANTDKRSTARPCHLSCHPSAAALVSRERRRPRFLRGPRPLLVCGRYAAGAIAAALGLFVWLNPPQGKDQRLKTGETHRASMLGSWFAPVSTLDDGFSPGAAEYERPHVSLRRTQREWLVIPSREPHEFFLIQVDRSHTRRLNVQQDF